MTVINLNINVIASGLRHEEPLQFEFKDDGTASQGGAVRKRDTESVAGTK